MILIDELKGNVSLKSAKSLQGDAKTSALNLKGGVKSSYLNAVWGSIRGDINEQHDLIDIVKPEIEVLGIPFNNQWELDIEHPWYWKLTAMEYIDPQTGVSHYYSAEEMIELINTRTVYLRFYTMIGLSYGFGDYFNFEYYEDLDSILGRTFEGTAQNMPHARFRYVSLDFENRGSTLYLTSSEDLPQDRRFLDEAYAMLGEHELIEATEEDINELFERFGE